MCAIKGGSERFEAPCPINEQRSLRSVTKASTSGATSTAKWWGNCLVHTSEAKCHALPASSVFVRRVISPNKRREIGISRGTRETSYSSQREENAAEYALVTTRRWVDDSTTIVIRANEKNPPDPNSFFLSLSSPIGTCSRVFFLHGARSATHSIKRLEQLVPRSDDNNRYTIHKIKHRSSSFSLLGAQLGRLNWVDGATTLIDAV